MKNRILSFLLAVVTVFNVCSMSVFSVELEENVQELSIYSENDEYNSVSTPKFEISIDASVSGKN